MTKIQLEDVTRAIETVVYVPTTANAQCSVSGWWPTLLL